MFGSYTHGSFYAAPSFGQPQTQIGPCGTDATPFPAVSADVFYGGGGGGGGHGLAATGPHRLAYAGYDSVQPVDSDFQPPYFPPPNPAAAQPVAGAGVFAHHQRQVPVVSQQSLQPPVVDQSMYWSPVNAAGVYTTGGVTPSNVGLHHATNVDRQKTYHALQQVETFLPRDA